MNSSKTLYTILAVLLVIIIGTLLWLWADTPGSDSPDAGLPPRTADDTADGDANGEEADMRLEQPARGTTVTSPLIVTGKARGTWFFEGTMPIRLIDNQGTLLAQASATSSGSWMTEDYIPFSAVLTFTVDAEQSGELIIAKDNPSGLPENDAEARIPLILAPNGTATFGWTTRTSDEHDFSIEHPRDAEVQPRDDRTTFLYLGPTQKEGTEMYDGISLTIAKESVAPGTALSTRARTLAEVNLGPDGSIAEPVAAAAINGRTAYRWRTESLGTFTHYLVGGGAQTAYHVYYTAPDPDNRGYAAAVERMLASFNIQ